MNDYSTSSAVDRLVYSTDGWNDNHKSSWMGKSNWSNNSSSDLSNVRFDFKRKMLKNLLEDFVKKGELFEVLEEVIGGLEAEFVIDKLKEKLNEK